MTKYLALCLLVFLSCKQKVPFTTGDSFHPTQNGFGVVVKQIGIDSGPGAALYFKGTNKQAVMVWPCVGTAGYPILYKGEIALLLADKPDSEGRLGHGALVAIKGSGPAMDISNDVLKVAASQANVQFEKALRVCQAATLVAAATNQLRVGYGANWLVDPKVPELEAVITWDEIMSIMDEVKKSGKLKTVTKTNLRYLQKDYRQE